LTARTAASAHAATSPNVPLWIPDDFEKPASFAGVRLAMRTS